MMQFVIWNVDQKKYVAPAGSERSFTKFLQKARIFPSKQAAASECCGNERPLLRICDATEVAR